jgi:hypothetical protein
MEDIYRQVSERAPGLLHKLEIDSPHRLGERIWQIVFHEDYHARDP